jgi:hypothetical protein
LEEQFSVPSAQLLWEQLDKEAESDPALAAVGKVFLGTPTDRQSFETFERKNVLFPAAFIVARALAVFET